MSVTNTENQKFIRIYNKDISKMLIYPGQNSNKYTRGKCCVVAGSDKFPGAAILASKAASKAGSGYTMLYTLQDNVKQLAFAMPSIPVDSFDVLFNNDLIQFDKEKPVAYVVGPGFVPNQKFNKDILLYVLENTDAPVIIDGGALTALRKKSIKRALAKRYEMGLKTVITPHLGEAKKIYAYYSDRPLNKSLRNSQFVWMLAEHTKTCVVLKGPNSYICDGKKAYLMRKGTEALAKAGTGDVLAGIIGGFVCQNHLDVFDACVIATIVHAESGSIAASDLTTICVDAQDVIDYLPAAIKQIQKSK